MYDRCEYYYYFNIYNQYNCTLKKECPKEYNKLIIDKNQCIDKCSNDNIYRFEYNNSCYIICPEGTYISNFDNFLCEKINISECTAEEIFNNLCKTIIDNKENKNKEQILKEEDNFVKNIKNEFLNGNMDSLLSNITEGEVLSVKTENALYQFTTTNNKNNKYSIINLGECENILKNHYNISINESLLIFKIDVYIPGHLTPIIEYEVYNSKTKQKLDLNYCRGINIKLLIPVNNIDEDNLFKYNSTSEFCNDICFPYTTKNGTDISLNDRKEECNNNSLSLCENNCEYEGYDPEAKSALCNCKLKIQIALISEIVLNKNILLTKINIKKSINIELMKCYDVFLSKNGILKNIGSYILLIIIFINLF